MKGKLYIDGRDAFEEYGISVAQYAYRQVIQMPEFKQLDVTDWPDENGVETDLSAPELNSRTLQIEFNINNIRYAEDLFETLSNGSYHEFRFEEIKKTLTLRMTTNNSFSSLIRLGKITLTFVDDFPQIPTGNHYPFGKTEVWQGGYEVDGVAFSQFGTWVLEGTDDNIRRAADAKGNLLVNTSNTDGAMYDGSTFKFKSKDVTLNLLIQARDIDEFWRRYNALFATLMRPENRVFFYSALDTEYDCHYKNSNVSRFDILRNGKVWCEFSVTLTFTDYLPVGQYMLLAHEDFALVVVDVNGTDTLIRIRPKRGISILSHMTGEYVTAKVDGKESIIYLND